MGHGSMTSFILNYFIVMTFLCHISTWQLHITIFMLFIEDTVLGFYHLTTYCR